eukprot:354595_1
MHECVKLFLSPCISGNKILCYLYYFGGHLRFYAQDIISVFSNIFDLDYQNNNQFLNGDAIKRFANALSATIRDEEFEHFYRDISQKKTDEFPLMYKEFPWINCEL